MRSGPATNAHHAERQEPCYNKGVDDVAEECADDRPLWPARCKALRACVLAERHDELQRLLAADFVGAVVSYAKSFRRHDRHDGVQEGAAASGRIRPCRTSAITPARVKRTPGRGTAIHRKSAVPSLEDRAGNAGGNGIADLGGAPQGFRSRAYAWKRRCLCSWATPQRDSAGRYRATHRPHVPTSRAPKAMGAKRRQPHPE